MPWNLRAYILLPGAGELWANGEKVTTESLPDGMERLAVRGRYGGQALRLRRNT